jgi:hypothetical protein
MSPWAEEKHVWPQREIFWYSSTLALPFWETACPFRRASPKQDTRFLVWSKIISFEKGGFRQRNPSCFNQIRIKYKRSVSSPIGKGTSFSG